MATKKTRFAPLPGPLEVFGNGEEITDMNIERMKTFIKRMERKLVSEKRIKMAHTPPKRIIESMRYTYMQEQPLTDEKQEVFDRIKKHTAFSWELYDIIRKYKIEYVTAAIKMMNFKEIAPCDFNDELVLTIKQIKDVNGGEVTLEFGEEEKRALMEWRDRKEKEWKAQKESKLKRAC